MERWSLGLKSSRRETADQGNGRLMKAAFKQSNSASPTADMMMMVIQKSLYKSHVS